MSGAASRSSNDALRRNKSSSEYRPRGDNEKSRSKSRGARSDNGAYSKVQKSSGNKYSVPTFGGAGNHYDIEDAESHTMGGNQ